MCQQNRLSCERKKHVIDLTGFVETAQLKRQRIRISNSRGSRSPLTVLGIQPRHPSLEHQRFVSGSTEGRLIQTAAQITLIFAMQCMDRQADEMLRSNPQEGNGRQ